jgi:hypothetical protein
VLGPQSLGVDEQGLAGHRKELLGRFGAVGVERRVIAGLDTRGTKAS